MGYRLLGRPHVAESMVSHLTRRHAAIARMAPTFPLLGALGYETPGAATPPGAPVHEIGAWPVSPVHGGDEAAMPTYVSLRRHASAERSWPHDPVHDLTMPATGATVPDFPATGSGVESAPRRDDAPADTDQHEAAEGVQAGTIMRVAADIDEAELAAEAEDPGVTHTGTSAMWTVTRPPPRHVLSTSRVGACRGRIVYRRGRRGKRRWRKAAARSRTQGLRSDRSRLLMRYGATSRRWLRLVTRTLLLFPRPRLRPRRCPTDTRPAAQASRRGMMRRRKARPVGMNYRSKAQWVAAHRRPNGRRRPGCRPVRRRPPLWTGRRRPPPRPARRTRRGNGRPGAGRVARHASARRGRAVAANALAGRLRAGA